MNPGESTHPGDGSITRSAPEIVSWAGYFGDPAAVDDDVRAVPVRAGAVDDIDVSDQ